jgi:CheY-like chemotaxis protein
MPECHNRILLLAEDDRDLAVLICREVQKILPEWEVCHVLDGSGAICRLGQRPVPDALITDLHMPETDGFALIEWVRHEKTLEALPIFVFSASANPSDQRRCEHLGADGFYAKGIGLANMRASLLSMTSRFERNHAEIERSSLSFTRNSNRNISGKNAS